MAFSVDEVERYQRQIVLPEWGAVGQERVRAAPVNVSGVGPAARAAVRYLAAAGVGQLWTQVSPDEARALNPHVEIKTENGVEVDRLRGKLGPDPALEIQVAGDGPDFRGPLRARIIGDDDREAVGAACAVEALKAILGLPHREAVSLPSLAREARGVPREAGLPVLDGEHA